jgi:hypothetical protein
VDRRVDSTGAARANYHLVSGFKWRLRHPPTGVLVIVALLLVFWPRDKHLHDDGPRKSGGNAERRTASAVVGDDGRGRRSREAPARDRKPRVPHLPEQLGDFVLPLVEAREVSLPKAMATLMRAYKDACQRSRTMPLDLQFEFPEAADQRISFSLERPGFEAALRHLAALAGCEVKRDGLRLCLSRFEGDGRRFDGLDSAQLSQLAAGLDRLGIAHGRTQAEVLEAAGMCTKSTFVVASVLDRLGGLCSPIEALRLQTYRECVKERQVAVKMKLIHSGEALDLVPGPIPAEKYQELMRSLAQRKDIELVTTSNFVTKDLQAGEVDLARTDDKGRWTGIRLEVEPERIGLGWSSRENLQYRPDGHPEPYLQRSGWWFLNDGSSDLALVGERDGRFTYRILTLEEIDSAGRPVRAGKHPSEPPVAWPVPDKPGFVFSPFNSKIIDVTDVPSVTLVADPTYPAAERKHFRVP